MANQRPSHRSHRQKSCLLKVNYPGKLDILSCRSVMLRSLKPSSRVGLQILEESDQQQQVVPVISAFRQTNKQILQHLIISIDQSVFNIVSILQKIGSDRTSLIAIPPSLCFPILSNSINKYKVFIVFQKENPEKLQVSVYTVK